tara:strand:+ start:429 stop:938 length:510 start_codon:yes stop_codon:yes gene_type:complete
LVLDVWIEVLVNGPLELVKVINILSDPIDGILETFYKVIILSNLGFVLLDEFTHVFLSGSEIIDDITQVSVNLVVMFEVSVHIIGLFLQLGDFEASWSDISLELLDLVIEDELELFELLGLLFETIDFLLELSDGGVFIKDLNTLSFDLKFQFLSILLFVDKTFIFILK